MNKIILLIVLMLLVGCKTVTIKKYKRTEVVVFKDTIQNKYPYKEYYQIDIFDFKTKKALFRK